MEEIKGICSVCYYGYNEDWILKEGLNKCPNCDNSLLKEGDKLSEIITNKPLIIEEVYNKIGENKTK